MKQMKDDRMDHTASDPDSGMTAVLGLKDTTRRKKTAGRWLLWITLLVMGLGATLRWTLNSNAVPIQYKTEPARRGDITVTVTATGSLEPTNAVEVGSELSGIIRSVFVDYNDRVTVGKVLAELDTTKLDAQVLKSRAALAAARAKVLETRATVKETESKLARLNKLYSLRGNKAVSQSDLDTAQAEMERAKADDASAKAAVSQAKATLSADETDLAKAVIRSPINGVVLTRNVESGQTVAASLEAPVLFTLAEDLARMELHVDVDEADVGLVQDGQEAVFTVDAFPDRRFPARIIQVRYGSSTTDGVVTYETVLNVNNTDLSLRPGMTATAEITVKGVKDAVVIPNAALRFSLLVPGESENSDAGGGLMSRLLPRPPQPQKKTHKILSRSKSAEEKTQQIWILSNDGHPSAFMVATGITDGRVTEVLDGGIEPGTALVIDMLEARK